MVFALGGMAQARYQAQVGTNTDVLTSQAQVSSAEFNLTQALTDYQSALADIYAGMGTSFFPHFVKNPESLQGKGIPGACVSPPPLSRPLQFVFF